MNKGKMDHEDDANMLYGDIENIGQDLEIQRITKENEELRKEVDSLKAETQELQFQIVQAVTQRDNLEKNMMTVYNTALKEISRKDRDLFALTSELDALKSKMS